MTDRTLVLLPFFVLALVLNALTVSVPGLRQGANFITLSKNLAPTKLVLQKDNVDPVFFNDETTIDLPVIVRKIFYSFPVFAGTTGKMSMFHPIKGQGPPVA